MHPKHETKAWALLDIPLPIPFYLVHELFFAEQRLV